MVKEETTYYAMQDGRIIGIDSAGKPNKFIEGKVCDTIGDAVKLLVRHARLYNRDVQGYASEDYGIRRVTKVTEYGVTDTYVTEEDL